jgi:hypothetical protein
MKMLKLSLVNNNNTRIKPMKKINLIKYIKSFFRRRVKEDHVIEVVIYDNGRIVEQHEVITSEDANLNIPIRFVALRFANSKISDAYGLERRRMKGRA